jgi:hypothetical protein
MATVTKTIGTNSRDYSTMTAWEADLDNTGVYDTGDDAVGECYPDGTFDETVTINGGATSGLNSIKLKASDEHPHKGVAGAGVKLVCSSPMTGANVAVIGVWSNRAVTIENLEITDVSFASGYNANVIAVFSSNTPNAVLSRMLIHDITGPGSPSGGRLRIYFGESDADLLNWFCYDCKAEYGNMQFLYPSSSGTTEAYNCSVLDISAPNGNSLDGFFNNGSLINVKNCICCVSAAGASSSEDYTPAGSSWDYNISADATATGTNSIASQTPSNVFVSTTSGSENLHILATSNAVKNGINLTNTPAGVLWDIDGRPRPSTRWDIGADQISFAASALERKLKLSYMNSLSLGDNSLASF